MEKDYKVNLCGLGVYVASISLAALPVFSPDLGSESTLRLLGIAVLASLVVAVLRVTGLHRRLHDPGAVFMQSLFGIAICAGLYHGLAAESRPQVMLMSLLWVALGVTHLGPLRTLTLLAAYAGIYGNAYAAYLMDVSQQQHSDAIYVALVSLVIGIFLLMRSSQYQASRLAYQAQAQQLEEAEVRIHEFTIQDAETTALKFAYFNSELKREKARVDRHGGTFSVGLIEIDGYSELSAKLGETVTAQLLREFTARATKLIRSLDTVARLGDGYRPLGRITGGRFGLMLPATDFKGALRCAERLHGALDFKAIRTDAGVVSLTLSIGVTQYGRMEEITEVMELAEHALGLAKRHNGNDFKGLQRSQGGNPAPQAAATRLAVAHR